MGTLTVKGGTLSVVGGASSPIEKLNSALAQATSTPVRILFEGSSTTEGWNASDPAHRYVDLLVGMMQAAHPSGLTESTVVASPTGSFGTLTTAVGIHGYNSGRAGDTSANFLDGTQIASITALNPRAVLHMIGAGDYGNGTQVPIATYKANVQAAITALKAALAGPCVHILIQSYQRMDVTSPAIPWSAYGTALAQIAAADPTNVAYIDLSGAYAAVGVTVPGTDPADLLDTDNTHQRDAGHRLMAETLRVALHIPPPAADTTAPSTPTGLTVGTPTASTVPLSWTASTDNVAVTGYKVRRGGTVVGTPTGASFTDTGLTASTAYSYTVSAVDAAGNESTQTSAVTGTTTSAAQTTLMSDDFARADNASSLGTATTGQAWSVLAGTWGIASGKAVAPAPGTALIDVSTADVDISATITKNAGTIGLLVRSTSDATRMGVFMDNGVNRLRIYMTNAGGTVFVTGLDGPTLITDGTTHVLRVVVKGSSLTAYLDGNLELSYTFTSGDLTTFGALTKVGMRQGASGTGTFDNLVCKTAP